MMATGSGGDGHRLAGRRTIVTGAATGIGAAAVDVLASAGATIAAIYHRSVPPSRLEDIATWHRCDLRRREDVNQVFDAIAESMGGLDVVINAAGLWASAGADCSEDELDFLWETNVKATVFVNQAARRHMRASGGGRIVNFGSVEGVRGSSASVYAMTKSAVHGWSRAAAQAWGREGITVNAVAPAVETPGAERFREFVGPERAAAVQAALAATMPVRGALGDPSADLGPALVFLASEESRFITGQLLPVDGGIMMLGS